MAIKDKYNGEPLINWDIKIKQRDPYTVFCLESELKQDILFYKFLQYKAFDQYRYLKKYANSKGIKIIGDLPIYVSMDSSDVWTNPLSFQVNNTLTPLRVAGVPPDLFSEGGQLWGNPLYNWDYLASVDYKFFIDRIKANFKLFDFVRIDHFIGFQNYYSIEYGKKDAKEGYWVNGPGISFFNKLKETLGDLNIIAEDLGVLNDGVIKLLNDTGFTRMKVTQFAFDSREDNDFLPHNYEKNTICYTGTHDNMTTKEWFMSIPKADYNYCLRYMNYKGKNETDALIKLTLSTISKIAIIPFVDYLGLGGRYRMNTPSTTGNNWVVRYNKEYFTSSLSKRIKDMTVIYGRSR
jgi:4-alpha-glucanotransferase